MKCLKIRLTTLEPVRISNDETSQHGQTDTLQYIPGSSLRGMVMYALSKDEDFEDKKKLLISDKVHFLNSYLILGEKELLPSLKGFYEDKKACDGKKPLDNVILADVRPGTKRASLGRYCYCEKNCICYTDAELGEELIINRRDKKVFRSQFIQKNQSFTGYIQFDDIVDNSLIDRIQAVFQDIVLLGSDRHTGHGGCHCTSERMDGELPYSEYRNTADRSEFFLLLLSGMTMRNRYGELAGLDLERLSAELGCSELELIRCAASTAGVFGYNRNWKGAVPSANMYEAGSIFHIRTKNGEIIPAECFTSLEERGLGIRRNEGFGQILIFDQYPMLCFKQPIEKKKIEKLEVAGTPEKRTVPYGNVEESDIRIAASGLLKARIKKAMEQYVVRVPFKISGVSNSELGGLQALCTLVQYEKGNLENIVLDYVLHNEQKSSRKKIHDGKETKNEFYRYLRDYMNRDLLELIAPYMKHKKILGFSVDSLLTKEEWDRLKMQLLIGQIRFKRKGVKQNGR